MSDENELIKFERKIREELNLPSTPLKRKYVLCHALYDSDSRSFKEIQDCNQLEIMKKLDDIDKKLDQKK